MKSKLVTAKEAVKLIRSRDTLCISGSAGSGTPETLIKALETRYLQSGAPFDLGLVYAAVPGDDNSAGANRLAHAGLLKRIIGGYWGLIPELGKLALKNEIEAYNLPFGVMSALFREIAGRRCGVLTKVGLGTFVDPRQSGGRLNRKTWESLVQLVYADNKEWMLYKTFPIDVAFIRGTTADANGNISMENESVILDDLSIAMAVKNSGGKVIAQVERIDSSNSLATREIKIPGFLVDHVVVAQPENHHKAGVTNYRPANVTNAGNAPVTVAKMPLDARKIVARRAALELPMGGIVNLGLGMPEGVVQVAAEEGILDQLTLTTEPGMLESVGKHADSFDIVKTHAGHLHQAQQFDFYDGGGFDIAILGMAQVDRHGHVNVSKYGSSLTGAGSFINISQSARKLIFAGSFTSKGLITEVKEQKLRLVQEGSVQKFVNDVEQITFNGDHAREKRQEVLFITERCVLELGREGLYLREVAPGINVQTDILDLLPFPLIIREPILMDQRLFRYEIMGLAPVNDLVAYRQNKQLEVAAIA